MLSRVADNLFWMSRYLERAEGMARALDVAFQLEMDLAGLVADDEPAPWQSLLNVLQQSVPAPTEGVSPRVHATSWLAHDLNNTSSILSKVNRARNNARGIRGRISSEMWRSLNHLYWRLRDPELINIAVSSPHEYFTEVQSGCQQFQGVCDATLPHDEGWQFLQLGRHLERAHQTLRLIDGKNAQLQSLCEGARQPLAVLEWAAVLKTCNAFEMYQRIYISRVERERAIEYLLLDAESPRSVRFSLEAAAAALAAIDRTVLGDHPAEKALGRMISDLRYADLEQMLAGDFHAFLAALLDRCQQTSRAIQEQYSLMN